MRKVNKTVGYKFNEKLFKLRRDAVKAARGNSKLVDKEFCHAATDGSVGSYADMLRRNKERLAEFREEKMEIASRQLVSVSRLIRILESDMKENDKVFNKLETKFNNTPLYTSSSRRLNRMMMDLDEEWNSLDAKLKECKEEKKKISVKYLRLKSK